MLTRSESLPITEDPSPTAISYSMTSSGCGLMVLFSTSMSTSPSSSKASAMTRRFDANSSRVISLSSDVRSAMEKPSRREL
jgi:hypothetical protein